MPSKFSIRLSRRGSLSSKQGNAQFYKGSGARTEGSHTNKGMTKTRERRSPQGLKRLSFQSSNSSNVHASKLSTPLTHAFHETLLHVFDATHVTPLSGVAEETCVSLTCSPKHCCCCAGAYVIRPERLMKIIAPDSTGFTVRGFACEHPTLPTTSELTFAGAGVAARTCCTLSTLRSVIACKATHRPSYCCCS